MSEDEDKKERSPPNPLVLKDEVSKCVYSLFECLVAEVIDRSKKALPLARRLNASLSFFCYDLLSVVDSRHVYELIALYLERIGSSCPPVLLECKLLFLRNVCDHEVFIELCDREHPQQSFLSSLLLQELVWALGHEDVTMRPRAARMLAFFMCKHEFDVRYQCPESKRFIAQIHAPLLNMLLADFTVYSGLKPAEKREVLVCVLFIVHHIPAEEVLLLGQLSVDQTHNFFRMLENCVALFEYQNINNPEQTKLLQQEEDGIFPQNYEYTEMLSPSMNAFLNHTNKQDAKATLEAMYMLKRNPVLSPVSSDKRTLREAMTSSQVTRSEARRLLRESLHPELKSKLAIWEANLSTLASLQALDCLQLFAVAASQGEVLLDTPRLESFTSVLTSLLSRRQSVAFWEAFLPIFEQLLMLHGQVLLSRENSRFLKNTAFYLLKAAVSMIQDIRKRAVVGIQLLLKVGFALEGNLRREAVALTVTFSELLSEIRVLDLREMTMGQTAAPENREAAQLRLSLSDLGSRERSETLLREVGLSSPEEGEVVVLAVMPEWGRGGQWQWAEVKALQLRLLAALHASFEHSALMAAPLRDHHALVESHAALAWAYADVPDLHIMWLLQLSDVHQEELSWAEAGQCAVAVAAIIMQAIVEGCGSDDQQRMWEPRHLHVLQRMSPMLGNRQPLPAAALAIEGYGTSKLTVDAAVKWLQTANRFFQQAELFHFCSDLLELIVPVHKARGTYSQLSRTHTFLTEIYEAVVQQESNPIPFKDASYYRVGFYGARFGDRLNRKEFVYREPRGVRLGDISEKLARLFGEMLGTEVHIIRDSRTVNLDDLRSDSCYLQITSVEPISSDDHEGPRARIKAGSTKQRVLEGEPPMTWAGRPAWRHFLFDTPFTKNGKTQGGLADQWKRRTVLTVDGSFPALVNRHLVIASEQREFSPVENAISMIQERIWAIKVELQGGLGQGGRELRVQGLQRVLQGSVAVQVNSGVLGVCLAFLQPRSAKENWSPAASGSLGETLSPDDVPKLTAAIVDFMKVCGNAIVQHEKIISEEDRDFHQQLVAGFSSLRLELSHYISGLPS